MNCRYCILWLLASVFIAVPGIAAPVIDPLANVTVLAGKSLILPITATSSSGKPLTYTITSSTNAIAVVMHTNNPFWQLAVAQAATNTAPGSYKTPYRGGLVTVTNVGTMTFMLFPEYAPHTVNVFQGLTTSGFYNSNTIFHRVISNFVIQGGDPKTNGSGGLVFQYNDEFNPQAMFAGSGQLALANSGPNTDGSQFFVTVGAQRSLDFNYTLFGQMVHGFPVLTNLNKTVVDTNSRPLADEIILSAGYVTNTTDTVITLTATNVSGITGTINVVADDGAGGRMTNTFTATTVTDTNSNNQPFLYPGNTVTNLVAPAGGTLTNIIGGVELDSEMLYANAQFHDQASADAAANSSLYTAPNTFKTLTYNVTNLGGQLLTYVVGTTNYVGPVYVTFGFSSSSLASIYYQYGEPPPNYTSQLFTFVFGDTAISAQSNNVTVLAAAPFTNILLATFTNAVPFSSGTNFTSSINWGDNTFTNGLVATNSSGQKAILGSHTYAYPGIYPVYSYAQSRIGASATILSYVTAISSPPKLTLVSPAGGLATNGFTFNLQLPAGLNGAIQVSTNLTTWTTLTNFIGTNAVMTFRDQAATNSGRRFYRALLP